MLCHLTRLTECRRFTELHHRAVTGPQGLCRREWCVGISQSQILENGANTRNCCFPRRWGAVCVLTPLACRHVLRVLLWRAEVGLRTTGQGRSGDCSGLTRFFGATIRLLTVSRTKAGTICHSQSQSRWYHRLCDPCLLTKSAHAVAASRYKAERNRNCLPQLHKRQTTP